VKAAIGQRSPQQSHAITAVIRVIRLGEGKFTQRLLIDNYRLTCHRPGNTPRRERWSYDHESMILLLVVVGYTRRFESQLIGRISRHM
jgi:hypothetical protein